MNSILPKRFCSVAFALLVVALFICAQYSHAQEFDDPKVGLKVDEARLRANRIRKISGKHLTIFTDLPSSKEVDELTTVFDLAVKQWQAYFKVKSADDFRAVCFLMKDKASFARAGVFPRALPDFKNGFTLGNKSFWMYEQPSHYMRRQLMIHEGTHAFLFSKLGPSIPPWFNEGLAELFGSHHWSDGKLQTRVTIQNRDQAPLWGRSRLIRERVAAGTVPSVDEIQRMASSAFLRVEPYAWVWALSAFLDSHPEFAAKFRELPSGIKIDGEVNGRFDKWFADSRSKMDEQWRAYLADMNYGVNGANAAIDYTPAKVQRNELRSIVAAKSWQNSGIKVEAGKSYLIRSKGRFVIRKSNVKGKPTDWPCEPNGVTIEYYRGAPLGKLMMVIKPDDPKLNTDFSAPQPIGLSKNIKAKNSGTLYFRVNESPAGLFDNSGGFLVSVVESD